MRVANALSAIVRATGNMLVAAKYLVAGSVLQIIAAGVLVFGLGPFPTMGIAGAAAGILIDYGLVIARLLHFLANRCTELRLRLSGPPVKLAPMAAILNRTTSRVAGRKRIRPHVYVAGLRCGQQRSEILAAG